MYLTNLLDKAVYNFGAVVAPAPPGKTGVNGMIIYIIGGINEKGNAINDVKVLMGEYKKPTKENEK